MWAAVVLGFLAASLAAALLFLSDIMFSIVCWNPKTGGGELGKELQTSSALPPNPMPYAQHPLAIDPVRTNILQIPQFYNEIKSLQSHADGLKGEIEMRKRELAELVQKESARKAEIISNVAPRPAGGSVRTSDVYHVVDLPSRFDDPGFEN